jgi:Concanavalin A-like lectin/glucanases superfamily
VRTAASPRSLVFAVAAACGRVGFAPQSDPGTQSDGGATIDTVAPTCAVAVPSQIRRYAFDGTANESLAAAHGTPVAGVQYVAGKFGQATQLDGGGARIQIPNFLELDYSVAFWVRTTAVAPGGPTDWWFAGVGIIDGDLCGNPPNGDWGISMINGGRISGAFAGPSVAMVNDGAWHPVLMTRAGALDVLELYVDGVFEGSADANSDGLIHSDQTFLGLGASPCSWSTGPYFAGAIDELLIFDRTLTATDAQALVSCAP